MKLKTLKKGQTIYKKGSGQMSKRQQKKFQKQLEKNLNWLRSLEGKKPL